MMRWTTAVLRHAATAGSHKVPQRTIKSLALSVYFQQPELGVHEPEILSRSTAFLLAVDSPDLPASDLQGPYAHLKVAEMERKKREHKRKHQYSMAGGAGKDVMDLGWLEFVPREVRPQVHVVCSSHVVSPFLWKEYYPHDWLSKVRQEHCTYALEVLDPESNDGEALVKVALHPQPFHHPEGRDLALMHLKDDVESLQLLQGLGVEKLYLRHPDKLYQKGEEMFFDGYEVTEPATADRADHPSTEQQQQEPVVEEDNRIFVSYKETGKLAFHTKDRFFCTTPRPLPEGLCGAPVLDKDGDLCGCVEGIVPVTHKDERLAGSAAFLPSYVVAAFVDYTERGLLQQMMPKDLFQMAVTAKKTNSFAGGVFRQDDKGAHTKESDYEEAYDIALDHLKKRYSKEEVDAILASVERERDEVMEIFDKEGGDLDEIMTRARMKTMQIREMVVDQYRKQNNLDKPAEDESVVTDRKEA